jgi:hypothetical protein
MATIVTKNSSTASAVPTTSDLVQGELAVNVTDKRIFTENASTQIVELGTNPSSITTATATVTGTLTANGTFASSNAVITGGSINSTPIGATTPSTIVGSTVTANTGFVGGLTGNVTGNLTGNVTGNVNGNLTGNVTGNVTASSGTTTLNDLVVNGTADFTNTKLTNITTPTVGSDAANKSYVDDTVAAVIDSAPAALDTLNELAAALGDDANFAGTVTTALATKLPLAGGTMTGAIAMGTSKITGLGDPTSAQDAATKTYVDTADALKLNLTGGTMSGAIAMGTNKITGVGNPTLAQDAATKDYVDDILGSATSAATSAAAAATSASNAATSASNAATSATASANSASAAAASYDAFDDRYLGDKASDPTLDNDGNALLTGALYFNTTSDVMKVYDGSAWNIAAISSASPTFTGTVTADGLTVGNATSQNSVFDSVFGSGGANEGIVIVPSATGKGWVGFNNGNNANIPAQLTYNFSSSLMELYSSGSLNIQTGAASRLNISSGGDISFYEDTGTTPKFFWDASAESLGIGTSSPTATTGLHIQGSDGASGSTVNVSGNEFFIDNNGDTGMTLGSSNTGTGGYVFADSNVALRAGMFYTHSTDQMSFRVASQTRVSIDSSGNVGIGTTSPFPFSSAQAGLTLSGTSGSFPTRAGALSFISQDTTSTECHIHARDAYMAFETGTSATSTERMRIDASGNVGIGTTSPATALDLVGEINFSGNTASFPSNSQPRLYRSGSSVGAYPFDTFGHLVIQARGDGSNRDIVFATGTAGANKTVITSSGNVGIGVTTVSEKLQVDGNIRIGDTATGTNDNEEYSITSGGQLVISANDSAADISYSALVLNAGKAGGAAASSSIVVIQTNNAEAMRIDSSGTLIHKAAAVFNEDGGNSDFRVESDTRSAMFFVDASTDRVGINTDAPQQTLEVRGKMLIESNNGGLTDPNNELILSDSDTTTDTDQIMGRISFNTSDTSNPGTAAKIQTCATNSLGSGELQIWSGTAPTLAKNAMFRGDQVVFNEDSNDMDFRVESDINSHSLFVQGDTGNVGIGTSSPTNFGSLYNTLTLSGGYGGAISLKNAANTVYYEIRALGDDLYFGSTTASNLRFKTTNATRMTITAGGNLTYQKAATFNEDGGDNDFRVESDTNTHALFVDASANCVGFNKSSPTRTVDIEGASEPLAVKLTAGSNPTIRSEHYSSTDANWYHIRFFTGIGAGGAILVNGLSGTVTYSTTSDYRLKENVVDMTGAIDRVKTLNPVRFNWKQAPNGRLVDGFIAHEVSEIVPEAVAGEKDAIDENGNIDPQGIDQAKLVPLLTAALQEAIKRIETLEAEVSALKP